MSKFIRMAETSQALSLAAMEEASRMGQREADLEHLLLALVLSDQPAGDILRGRGITVDSARRAVHDLHESRLAGLGIRSALPEPGPIVFHVTEGYEWKQRASDLIGRSGGRGRDGSAAAVLRELVTEPSGTVADLLERLGTSPEAVVAELDRLAPAEPPASAPSSSDRITGSSETFVPGAVDDVWMLLSDPGRIPEWEPGIESIDASAGPDGTWIAHAVSTRPDGSPTKIKERFRRRGVELLGAQRPDRAAWRFTYPDAEKNRPVIIEFALAPTNGGTRVTITISWLRADGWRRAVGAPLRPVQKFLMWITQFQIGSAISRVFR